MNMIPFQFGRSEVRAIDRDGKPWFVANDCCAALGLVNSRDAVRALDPDEKGVASTDTLGGNQQVTVISESGLYALVLRCRDAMTPGSVAHRFRKWVTGEVLPALRERGSYGQSFEVPKTYAGALRLAADLDEQKTALEHKVEEQAPKVAALERIAEAEGLFSLMVAAKNLGMAPQKFIAWLAEMNWIYKRSFMGPWLAHQVHIANGSLTHKIHCRPTNEDPDRAYTQTLVTARGIAKLAYMIELNKQRQDAARAAAAQAIEEVLH